MGSRIVCVNGHGQHCKRYTFLDAVSRGNPPKCKVCSGKLEYITSQTYPQHGNKTEDYVLEKVERIHVNYKDYHPFLLKLKSMQSGEIVYWLQYWVNVKGKIRYGRYSPLLDRSQMEFVHKNL